MKKLQKLFYSLILILGLSSCAQVSGLQTARTVGKDNGEIGFSFGALGTEVNGETAGIGSFEAWGRYGFREKLDLGLKLSSTGTNMMDVRWQVLGNRQSVLAAGVGLGVGVNAFGFTNNFQAGVFDIHVPIYTSIHLGDGFALYFSPRYISTVMAIGNTSGRVEYGGASTGLELGKKLKLVADFSYFVVGNEQNVIPIQQVSLGLKLALGSN